MKKDSKKNPALMCEWMFCHREWVGIFWVKSKGKTMRLCSHHQSVVSDAQ